MKEKGKRRQISNVHKVMRKKILDNLGFSLIEFSSANLLILIICGIFQRRTIQKSITKEEK